MVEKVGLANIFHTSGLENAARPPFYTFSTNLWGSLINHEMVEKAGLANTFHTSGLENVARLPFPLFPRISDEVL